MKSVPTGTTTFYRPAELKRGEIIYDRHFRYSDARESCDKLLLVLNKDDVLTEDVVIVPATTDQKNTAYSDGCNQSEHVYYFAAERGFYREKTVIQYDFVERIPFPEFERRMRYREMERKDQFITDRELQDILACLKRLKEDIPTECWELIF